MGILHDTDFEGLRSKLTGLCGPAAFNVRSLLEDAIASGTVAARNVDGDSSDDTVNALAYAHISLATQLALILTLDDIADSLNTIRATLELDPA